MSDFGRFERMGERLAASLRPPSEDPLDECPSCRALGLCAAHEAGLEAEAAYQDELATQRRPEDAALDRADAALAKLGRAAGDLATRAGAGVPGDLAKLEALAAALEALLVPRG